MIKAKPSQSNFAPIPAGSYPARCYSVIHIGTIPVEWQGESRMVDKVRFGFEFPTETKVFNEEKGEQPYVLSTEFTLAFSSKAKLRSFLESWQGKKLTDMEAIDTDVEELVGKEGLATVIHSEGKNGNTYANISSMSPLPKGLKCPPAVNQPFILNYSDKWSDEKFNGLPEFIQDRMTSSQEFASKMERRRDSEPEVTIDDIDEANPPF